MENVRIVRKGIVKKVVTTIPAQEIVEEVEVDTLKEFLQEVDLTKEDLLVAVKEYKEDKVTQPKYNMADLLRIQEEGKERAKRYLTPDFKESKIKVGDLYVADALVNSNKWVCIKKSSNPLEYVLERV